MRKLLWLFLLAIPVHAQVVSPSVTYVASAPSGTCTQAPPVQVLNSSGAIYTCDNGTWAVQGGGGGSTAFSAITAGTNTTAAMVIGTGASLALTGTGTAQCTSSLAGFTSTGTLTLNNGTINGGPSQNVSAAAASVTSASSAPTFLGIGGQNAGTGPGGNSSLRAGVNTATFGNPQGQGQILQSKLVTATLTTTFNVVSMTTTSEVVVKSPLGAINNIGIAQTAGGTNAQIFVVSDGESTVRFDGTPVVGDEACAPPTSTGTAGLAHDGGTSACPAGQKVGVIAGQVSGTGSGSTAVVILQIGS